MTRSGIVILIVAAVVFLSLGFVVGQVVQAMVNTPGSANDPIVSQSFVEKLVGEKVAVLQTQIESLQAEISRLNDELNNKDSLPVAAGVNSPADQEEPDDTDATDSSQKQQVQVTAGSVNVRRGPSTNTEAIDSVKKGEKLTWTEKQNGWYKVTLSNGAEGWILGDLVTEI
ncbi:MAG: SH3 domain-containing protein [Clostridiales bacterium]|jgi:uncharacterized small protein (DUF1192 family)|nr:SH3 domain-containing protein [Clostridiales bacterium]MDR2713048.1 SH3 domain-containing protein [Clostridiales bacterium]